MTAPLPALALLRPALDNFEAAAGTPDNLIGALESALLALHGDSAGELLVNVFETPSANVLGVVTATLDIGKSHASANATLLDNKPPSVRVKLPTSLELDELPVVVAMLLNFSAAVRQAQVQAQAA